MKQDASFVEFGASDPAVAALITQGSERIAERKLSPAERKRKAKDRARIRERKARRVTYDLPPALRHKISSIAEEQGIPASQLVAWLLLDALERFGDSAQERHEQLAGARTPSASPRYEWNLTLDADRDKGK